MSNVYDQPDYVEKRPRYFNGEYLNENVFINEQQYHIDRQRRHDRLMHTAGVAEGLELARSTDVELQVKPGTAIDPKGRTLLVSASRTLAVGTAGRGKFAVYIRYAEQATDTAAADGAMENFTRFTEQPELFWSALDAPAGDAVRLGDFEVGSDNRIAAVTASTRPFAGVRLPSAGGKAFTLASSSNGSELTVTGPLTVTPPPGATSALKVTGASGGSLLEVRANGTVAGPITDYARAQLNLVAGGVLSVKRPAGIDNTNCFVKWSSRFFAMSMRGSSFPGSGVEVFMPSAGVPAANTPNNVERKLTQDGIRLIAFEALYAVHEVGKDSRAVTFQILGPSASPESLPSNWILVAVYSGDDDTVKFGNGVIVPVGSTWSGGQLRQLTLQGTTDDASAAALTLQNKSGSPLLAARNDGNLVVSGRISVQGASDSSGSALTVSNKSGTPLLSVSNDGLVQAGNAQLRPNSVVINAAGEASAASLSVLSANGKSSFSVKNNGVVTVGAMSFLSPEAPSEANWMGLKFPADPGGGLGDTAFIRYFAQAGESTRLQIGIENDADDTVALWQMGQERLTVYNGNVGINVPLPQARLDVMGATANDQATAFRIKNSNNDELFSIRNDGVVTLGRTRLYTNGAMEGATNDYMKAQTALSGGGTVKVVEEGAGCRLSWSKRFIAISMGKGIAFPQGELDIVMPSAEIPVANVHDGTQRSTGNGVLLYGWEALYAAHTPGDNNWTVTYYIRSFAQSSPYVVPSNWVLVAVVNDDDKTVKLGTGATLPFGSTWQAGSMTGVTEPLRVVRGIIESHWRATGSGFTLDGGYTPAGAYRIFFSPAFTKTPPTVIATPAYDPSQENVLPVLRVTELTLGSVKILTNETDDHMQIHTPFHFIAMGW